MFVSGKEGKGLVDLKRQLAAVVYRPEAAEAQAVREKEREREKETAAQERGVCWDVEIRSQFW